MRSHKSILLIIAPLFAIACLSAAHVRAEIVTQIIEFVTPSGSSQNQLTVQGRLNTLAQTLGVVDCGNALVNINGLLRAQLTLDVPQEGDIEILGFELLSSSFTQSGVNLFYDVPNTTRRVTFSATGLQFGLQFGGQNNNNQQLLAAGPNIPTNSYQMVQNTGTAQIGITNRPSKQQNLAEQSVLSTYDSTHPAGQASFAILPPPVGSEDSLIELNLPLSHQQLHYAGVGLPVTLNYSGTLSLIGSLPLVNNTVPEPGTLALAGAALLTVCCRRRRAG
jgi:hypothetical protein